MSANYKQLADFTKKIEKLNNQQKEEFIEACCKELAARLLAKVIKRTPSDSGTLRRGWTGGQDVNPTTYANGLNVQKIGDKYHIDIINPISYAVYVEHGHRTRKKDGYGWAEGHHMLTISEAELNSMSDAILQKKLNKFMKDAFN